MTKRTDIKSDTLELDLETDGAEVAVLVKELGDTLFPNDDEEIVSPRSALGKLQALAIGSGNLISTLVRDPALTELGFCGDCAADQEILADYFMDWVVATVRQRMKERAQ